MHTIVIADDNISFAEEMRNYFTNNTDFKVVGIAPDGVEAIKLVEKHKPDFLLLDIVMPELDGFGVLSALSAFDEKPKTNGIGACNRRLCYEIVAPRSKLLYGKARKLR